MDHWTHIFLLFTSDLNKVKQVGTFNLLPFSQQVLKSSNLLSNVGTYSAQEILAFGFFIKQISTAILPQSYDIILILNIIFALWVAHSLITIYERKFQTKL